MADLKAGTVGAIIHEKAKARSQKEWEGEVNKVWKEATESLGKMPGFKGIMIFWNKENNGDVIMMGLWESLEQRLNYEGTTAKSVQSLFNPLFEKKPDRPKYVLTHSYLPK